jgi:hypothetical protein
VDAEQVLAFRLARSGLARREAGGLAEAATCPASDFARDGALLALAARCDGLTRERYDEATDSAELVVAHLVRGAIHATAPDGFALFGRALVATGDEDLAAQIGRPVQQAAAEHGLAPTAALEEVAGAARAALGHGRRLDRDELHAELRARVRPELLPWCRTCRSHHVAPMLWRFALVRIGARLDSARRHLLGEPGPPPPAGAAVRRFLQFYAPATPQDFAEWAGVARPHARRLWAAVEEDLCEVPVGKRAAWAAREDLAELESPPDAEGVRLLPPGDPYLQHANRPLLAPDPALRKRLFRPVAGPGAVLARGRLAGLWRAKARGRRTEIAVERLGRFARADLEAEAERMAALRGASGLVLTIE